MKRQRNARRWSQADLGNAVDLDPQIIYRIESGQRKVGLDEALAIARAFQVSIDALTNPDRGMTDLLRLEIVEALGRARSSAASARAAIVEAIHKAAETVVDLPDTHSTTGNPYLTLGDDEGAIRLLDEALTSAKFWIEQVGPLTKALDRVLDDPAGQPDRQRGKRSAPLGTRERGRLLAVLDDLARGILPVDESNPKEGPDQDA